MNVWIPIQPVERRALTVRGIVQGVGFRPFVHALARRLGLGGWVKNHGGCVEIEVEGPAEALDGFLAELRDRPPPLARIEDLSWTPLAPLGECRFRIDASASARSAAVHISPDVATCGDCLRELLDPADRRFRYPFLNCTQCGPRLTIVTGAPYDRERTTMQSFAMCAACRAEYDDPADRRFHAQPTACPRCGPRLRLLDAAGAPLETGDPLAAFALALCAGKIGALKGLGGYHLVCDAQNGQAIGELRRRKLRDEKPFAIMAADLQAAASLCEISPQEGELLQSARAPIVLLRKRSDRPHGVAEEVAPGNPCLGLMLPCSPLHHLLLRAVGGRPLVATSGNRAEEPIAWQDDEAPRRLAGIADLFLSHDRPIHCRCDDSVTRVIAGAELPLRRSRGYAPEPLRLPVRCQVPVLAVGGQLKSVFGLGREDQAFLSHHLGDLDHFDAYREFEQDMALYERLFAVQPRCIVHDLHPDYASTRYALARAGREGLERLAVQHHHAHMASCMAENELRQPVIGVTFDGTGFGTDGAVWGGEFLVGDYRGFWRAAHLRYVGMPGGDRAIREPWRMAAAHLLDAGLGLKLLESRVAPEALRAVCTMIERQVNSPSTSSAGRLFDAVAGLALARDRVSYEGQAAIETEWLAAREADDGIYPWLIEAAAGPAPGLPRDSCAGGSERQAFASGVGTPLTQAACGNMTDPGWIVDTRPLIAAVAGDAARGIGPSRIARRFHATLVDMIAGVCGRIRGTTGLNAVVLSGGVFMNALLTTETIARLRAAGFEVYRHRLVPCNDGGLSLGQLAIAAANRPATQSAT